jgi:amphi-Trp domain-containing protein
MSDFKQEERLSRQRAAERLIDIAYGLTAGGRLELCAGGRRITVPVGNELLLERELKSRGERVTLELELSWSAAGA